MRDWFRTQGRHFLSLLADLGGALAFVVAAIGFTAAAVVGTLLVLVDVFPQPFLTFLVLAAALGATGMALHLLRGRLAPPARPVAAPPTPVENPYSQAAVLQKQHAEEQADKNAEENVLERRRALRQIREELRDNRRCVQRAGEGETDEIRQLTSERWTAHEKVLLDLADPEPHSAAREAYREIGGIEQSQLSYNPAGGYWEQNDIPSTPLQTDIQTALEAIDDAVNKLSAAELG
ncbi:MAG TPA: hypothetical protein VLC07_05285 [Solirubrobacterales bacterium]|nr:hypothetical protein [Solirubrobacterales bacterium]